LFANIGAVYDIGSILPETSPAGSVLTGLFGYRSAPTPLEVAAYLGYLIPVLTLFLFEHRLPFRRQRAVPA
jgi:high-affinity iron transporter